MMIYRLPSGAGEGRNVFAVSCCEPKKFPFAEARSYAQSCLGIHSFKDDAVRFESYDGSVGWPHELAEALDAIDPGKARGEGHEFVALRGTLLQGPFKGTVAIGLGSNREKQQKALIIALIRTVKCPSIDPELHRAIKRASVHDARVPDDAAAPRRATAPKTQKKRKALRQEEDDDEDEDDDAKEEEGSTHPPPRSILHACERLKKTLEPITHGINTRLRAFSEDARASK
jgi:hypothetical protein